MEVKEVAKFWIIDEVEHTSDAVEADNMTELRAACERYALLYDFDGSTSPVTVRLTDEEWERDLFFSFGPGGTKFRWRVAPEDNRSYQPLRFRGKHQTASA